jgi:putative methionine-R-sulfoxide reductase with GAF domain
MTRADTFRGALEAIERILNRGGDADDVLRQVVSVLHDRCDHYSWVGIYLVEGDDLVLGPWKGPEATEHVRIPIGQGICGAAAASGQTEVVDDVNADPRYLACFPSTRSEIVVPIAYEEWRGHILEQPTCEAGEDHDVIGPAGDPGIPAASLSRVVGDFN